MNCLFSKYNTLDTFSYILKHGIKKPLSYIRLEAQMLLMKKDISQDMLIKLANNILDASSLITEMIDKVVARLNTITTPADL